MIDIRPQVLRNNLQINRGDGTFAEATYYAGLEASEWSWGPIFLDVDLDGFEDILVTNGQLRDFQNVDMANRIDALRAAGKLTRLELLKWMRSYPSLVTAKVIFHNRGDRTFEEKGADCIAELEGMFAIAIWDEPARRLTLARDRATRACVAVGRRS